MTNVETSTINEPSKSPVSTRFRKSPITLLKEECLELRQKTSEGELLIAEQAKEIERIKELLQKNEKKGKKTDDSHKSKLKILQSKSKNEPIKINMTSKKSFPDMSPSGKTKSNPNLQDEIERLEKQLDMQEYRYQNRIEGYKRLLEEKDREIQKHQAQIDSIKSDHINQIIILKAQHQEEYRELEKRQLHSEEMQKIIKVKVEKKTSEQVHTEFERILYEIEQEEHSHQVALPVNDDNQQQQYRHQKSHSLDRKQPITAKLNQQWWTQKFMPTEAMSWPAPQPLSNLRKVHGGKGFRM